MLLYNANILSLTIQVVPHTSTDSSLIIPHDSMRDISQAASFFILFLFYLESLIPPYYSNILLLTIQVVPHTRNNSSVIMPLMNIDSLVVVSLIFTLPHHFLRSPTHRSRSPWPLSFIQTIGKRVEVMGNSTIHNLDSNF